MPMTRLLGLRYVFGGNPTTASGMAYLGDTRGRIGVNPNVEVATGRIDRLGRAPVADGIYVNGPAPLVTVPFIDEAIAKLAKHMLGLTEATSGANKALLFGRGTRKVAASSIMTLLLLPQRPIADYPANLTDDPEAWWLTAAIPAGSPEFGFELQEGEDIYTPHEVQFIGAVRETDHAGAAIPEAAQIMFKGSCTAAGLASWTAGMPAPAALAAALAA